jgi:AcrR family transcriptional regulator
MPRHPDPDLEDRVLRAADALWKRGGTKALTMRAVARAAGTNTPAVYRRFKDRDDLVRGILLRVAGRLRKHFEQGETLQGMGEAYLDYALKNPNDYRLFFEEARLLNVVKGRGGPRPIRESRPNFDFAEKMAAKELGGVPEDHTTLALEMWALLHGTAMMIIAKAIPEGHEEELKAACRAAVKVLIETAGKSLRKG